MNKSDVELTAVGDIFLGDHYFNLGHGLGSVSKQNGISFIFNEIKNILKTSDITFGNLETPLASTSSKKNPVERAAFRGNPFAAKELKENGFNLINIANNHIMQHGREAFKSTISKLKDSEIQILGLKGRGKFHSQPILKTIRNLQIGFLGYSLINDHTDNLQALPYANDEKKILYDVKNISKIVNFVVVSIHWGDEGIQWPSKKNITLAKKIVDNGARVVLGHHSHTFQPVERYKNALIFYSLGNFIFELFWHRMLIHSAIVKIWCNPLLNDLEYKIYPIKLERNYKLYFLNKRDLFKFNRNLKIYLKHVKKYESDIYEILYRKRLFSNEQRLQILKIIYLFSNLHKGDTRLKTAFIGKKIYKIIS